VGRGVRLIDKPPRNASIGSTIAARHDGPTDSATYGAVTSADSPRIWPSVTSGVSFAVGYSVLHPPSTSRSPGAPSTNAHRYASSIPHSDAISATTSDSYIFTAKTSPVDQPQALRIAISRRSPAPSPAARSYASARSASSAGSDAPSTSPARRP
jgi:hypothetical protein